MNEMKPLKVVFLGTPEIVVPVGERLFCAQDICRIELVVTQPPARRGRGRDIQETPSPVAEWAYQKGLRVLTPEKVGETAFLQELTALEPDVCVTAAYGQYLPRAFLSVPKLGTLNIHPSLLPQFRGAAPVQRTLEAGLKKTGVTVLFSTPKMDAGPIVAQSDTVIEETEDAQQLLDRLFRLGSDLLVNVLGTYQQSGFAGLQCVDQNESLATEAPKISAQEGLLQPRELLVSEFLNKLRAFALWPGVKVLFNFPAGPTPVKILKARERVMEDSDHDQQDVWFSDSGLCIRCKSKGSVLEVLELQLPGKRVLAALEARNGWPGGRPQLTN